MFGDHDIDRAAHEMFAQYGELAAIEAAKKLNECIDSGDYYCRDTWAQIVHRIHELYGSATPAKDLGSPLSINFD